jgi:hypothetical protein
LLEAFPNKDGNVGSYLSMLSKYEARSLKINEEYLHAKYIYLLGSTGYYIYNFDLSESLLATARESR